MLLAHRFATAVAVLLAAAVPLTAQGTAQNAAPSDSQLPAMTASAEQAPTSAAAGAQRLSFVPTEQNATVGVHALSPSGSVPIAPPRRARTDKNVTMMIVGGAVLVLGAVVGGPGGDVIMIGGGVIGIVGLYRYLQ